MKFNWNLLKILFTVVLMLGTIFWAVGAVRSRSYEGRNLNVDLGGGTVTVTNPSEEIITAQLVGEGSRSFAVSSITGDISGSSIRQGSGRTATQSFEFVLPPGISEFTVVRGTNVHLVSTTDADVSVRVQPLGTRTMRNTLIAAAVVILGGFFYLSHVTKHHWISLVRGKAVDVQTLHPVVLGSVDSGQGQAARSYGDNRGDRSL